jgi:hypothetical protein
MALISFLSALAKIMSAAPKTRCGTLVAAASDAATTLAPAAATTLLPATTTGPRIGSADPDFTKTNISINPSIALRKRRGSGQMHLQLVVAWHPTLHASELYRTVGSTPRISKFASGDHG